MAQIAQKYQDQLKRIKENIDHARLYFDKNYKRFYSSKKFVFETSLTDTDKTVLSTLGKPQLEFNIGEAYISRLIGEFSKQEPSIEVGAEAGIPVDPGVIEMVENHMRYALDEARKDSFANRIYKDQLGGGFSVGKIWTEYANEMSMRQVIRWGRCFDPTLVVFDPMAKYSHKGDGSFSAELFPMRKEDFIEQYPNVDITKIKFNRGIGKFNWSYKNNQEEIILVADYYEKKKKKIKIVEISTGHVMPMDDYKKLLEWWEDQQLVAQAPVIVGKPRQTDITTICRYQLIENQIISYEETIYKYLPHVFFDGNSEEIRDGEFGEVYQFTKPYLYHLQDLQKLKNFAGQTLANELENMIMHKFKVAKESIPKERDYQEAYSNVQKASTLVYNFINPDNTAQTLPPPEEINRIPTPPEVSGTFSMVDQMAQSIIGSYDASLGINNNQLSGIAIVEGATQSNAAAMPYIIGYLAGLNQMAQIYLDLIPKYLNTPQNVPILDKEGKKNYVNINQKNGYNFVFPQNALNVKVEAGVNFSIQKSRALNQIIAMQQNFPQFQAFIAAKGLPTVLDNMEIRGLDQLKKSAEEFMKEQAAMAQQQQQMQGNMPNPEMMKMQLAQQRLQMDSQQNQQQNQLDAAKLQLDAQRNENERAKILMEAQMAQADASVQILKANTEKYAKQAELAIKGASEHHNMTHRSIELAHNIMQSAQKPVENMATAM